MAIKIAEKAPKHFGQFVIASSELEQLQEAHFKHLAQKQKSVAVKDSETVFMKAGITLLCSAWEAYVEDLARNGVSFLIENCQSVNDLPLEVRKNVAKEVKEDKNELSPWTLAGDNWRTVVKTRFETAVAKQANTLNSPKSSKIKQVYKEMLGIDDITISWEWEHFDQSSVCGLIDHLVEMRGSFAHGRSHALPAGSLRMLYLKSVVIQCACLMNNYVREHVQVITGKEPWTLARFQTDWKRFTKPDEAT